MQITELHVPVNGGTLLYGKALSRRGRRYDFLCDVKGRDVSSVYREDPTPYTEDGRTFWKSITAPKALRLAVKKLRLDVRKVVRS